MSKKIDRLAYQVGEELAITKTAVPENSLISLLKNTGLENQYRAVEIDSFLDNLMCLKNLALDFTIVDQDVKTFVNYLGAIRDSKMKVEIITSVVTHEKYNSLEMDKIFPQIFEKCKDEMGDNSKVFFAITAKLTKFQKESLNSLPDLSANSLDKIQGLRGSYGRRFARSYRDLS